MRNFIAQDVPVTYDWMNISIHDAAKSYTI